ncbi:xylose isomerase [Aliidongia dinghuensis]|uniref:Xylose isomerase n=1 Tax=Aliidongia dinghuensis TaxID=1867774 RepID=A0A8J2YRW9_9PROT|nr:sugar phosphate isomerase/epimerase family protein [Aliidongia dinghuensis]GGF11389.1 xylose isomerase [Aliidongia dinghuensis]
MADLSRLSLNTITVREQWTLAQCIEGCARHGIPGISPWRDKLAAYGLERATRHIRDAGLHVSGLCRGGMFTLPNAIEDNKRAIDEAAALGADCLVMVVGGLLPGSKDLARARGMVADGLAAVLPHARAAGVKLALEPLHPMTCADRAVLSTTAQALDLADALGDGVGVALDVYHIWWDPEIARSIARAGSRILGFHVSDWLVPTRDTALDRGMMGDGVIDIPDLRAQVEAAGYHGLIEVEIMSERDWWRRDPDEVLGVMKERFTSAV